MSVVEHIILHLDGYERADFLGYAERQPRNTREVELIRLLLREPPLATAEIKASLYPTEKPYGSYKRDAYNALRKRVLVRLVEWMVVREADAEELSNHCRALVLIAAAHKLSMRNANDAAYHLLNQAERLAAAGRHYEVLDVVYSALIYNALELRQNAASLLAKASANRLRADRMRFLQTIYVHQKQRIHDAMQQGRALDPQLAIRRIFKEVQVSVEDANDPAFMHLLCRIVRSAMVAGKDYTVFGRFVERVYKGFKKKNLLRRQDEALEVDYIYMCAHAAYRNKQFAKAEDYCLQFLHVAGKHAARRSPLYPRYMALRASVASMSGRNTEAIDMLENALKHRHQGTEHTEWLNNQLNLTVYYFQAANFRKANRTLVQLDHDRQLHHTKMGMEWCFKKELIELIVHYELGNAEHSLKMCDAILKKYKGMLDQTLYGRARVFIGFLRRMIQHPDEVQTAEFRAEVKSAQLAWPLQKEDVQAISFFSWLRSKMVDKPYYHELQKALAISGEGVEKEA
jgi:tetratricopeptide (TPR) repeat protein